MKKFLLILGFIYIYTLCFSQNAYKIIYSNPLTHCYVTAVSIDDSTVYYSISETSDRKIFRLTDRSETQQLGLFDKDTTLKIFNSAILLFDMGIIGETITVNQNIILQYVRIFGIKCVKFENKLIGVSFNINRQTAEDVIKILNSINP